jgi:hypothetical protein
MFGMPIASWLLIPRMPSLIGVVFFHRAGTIVQNATTTRIPLVGLILING